MKHVQQVRFPNGETALVTRDDGLAVRGDGNTYIVTYDEKILSQVLSPEGAWEDEDIEVGPFDLPENPEYRLIDGTPVDDEILVHLD